MQFFISSRSTCQLRILRIQYQNVTYATEVYDKHELLLPPLCAKIQGHRVESLRQVIIEGFQYTPSFATGG